MNSILELDSTFRMWIIFADDQIEIRTDISKSDFSTATKTNHP
jgi:hypothetical protein